MTLFLSLCLPASFYVYPSKKMCEIHRSSKWEEEERNSGKKRTGKTIHNRKHLRKYRRQNDDFFVCVCAFLFLFLHLDSIFNVCLFVNSLQHFVSFFAILNCLSNDGKRQFMWRERERGRETGQICKNRNEELNRRKSTEICAKANRVSYLEPFFRWLGRPFFCFK